MTCASTRARLEPKVRREAGLLTAIGLSHAENVANRATRGVADNHQPSSQKAKAEHAAFTVVFARVLDFQRNSLEDENCVLEVQASLSEGTLALGRIVGNAHLVSVSTITCRDNHPGYAKPTAACKWCS